MLTLQKSKRCKDLDDDRTVLKSLIFEKEIDLATTRHCPGMTPSINNQGTNRPAKPL